MELHFREGGERVLGRGATGLKGLSRGLVGAGCRVSWARWLVGSEFCTFASWGRGRSWREEWRQKEAESCSCKEGSEGESGNRLFLDVAQTVTTSVRICGVPWD